MRPILPLLLVLGATLGSPPAPRETTRPAPAVVEARFAAAARSVQARLPALLAPLHEAFARARAGTPAFAAWSNSSCTALALGWDGAVDWWSGASGPDSRVSRRVRARFEQEVLSPAALEGALAETAAGLRAALDGERLQAFLELGVDSRCLTPGEAPPPATPASFVPDAADLVPRPAAGALLYRATDLGLDRFLTGAIAPALLRLAAGAGLRVGSLGGAAISLGLSLVVTAILEWAYDRLVEGALLDALARALSEAESALSAALETGFEALVAQRFHEDARIVAGAPR